MKRGFLDTLVFSFTIIAFAAHAVSQAPQRWTADRANQWYAQQAWLVGANYIPSDAINELEMFQAATFNPALNDKELGLAESIGMNTMRVFLQDQLWQQDPQGLQQASRRSSSPSPRSHHIRPLLVLFDSCWETNPHLGPQHPPIPGVHNSGWVQSPGKERLMNPSSPARTRSLRKGVVGAFAKDDRVSRLGYLERTRQPKAATNPRTSPQKSNASMNCLPQAFAWARSVHPIPAAHQRCLDGNWSDPAKESAYHQNSARRVRYHLLPQLRLARGI